MENFKYAKNFAELMIYRKAFCVAKRIFEMTRWFSKEETHSLTDQIRRSSRSFRAQIAEAWGNVDMKKISSVN